MLTAECSVKEPSRRSGSGPTTRRWTLQTRGRRRQQWPLPPLLSTKDEARFPLRLPAAFAEPLSPAESHEPLELGDPAPALRCSSRPSTAEIRTFWLVADVIAVTGWV